MTDSDRDAEGRFLPDHAQAGPGRDSLYTEEMNEQARKLALLGLTDAEIAEFFGISVRTYYNWMNEHIAFFHAVNAGKVVADAEVAASLYKKATGITYEVERAFKGEDGKREIVKLSIYEPPDTGAMKLWLTNRRRKDWSDSVKVQGDPDAPLVHVIERRIVKAGN